MSLLTPACVVAVLEDRFTPLIISPVLADQPTCVFVEFTDEAHGECDAAGDVGVYVTPAMPWVGLRGRGREPII